MKENLSAALVLSSCRSCLVTKFSGSSVSVTLFFYCGAVHSELVR